MRNLILFLSLSCFGILHGQDTLGLADTERKLEDLLTNLRSAKTNSDKEEMLVPFKNEMERVLRIPGAMDYSFSRLKTVGFIDSPDKQLRIVNWNVEQDDNSHKYYCYVLFRDKKTKEIIVNELQDISAGMPTQPTEILGSDQWYGALYYKIIPVEKSGKTIYTVLGWDYYSPMSQVKLIDAMYLSGKSVKLGSPIFKLGKETVKRVFYEHSKKATMYLNYEADRKRIMMDHLSPETPGMNKFRSYYVPDLSYDAFVFENGKWILHEDVVGVNGPDSKKQMVYVKNEKTGKIEAKEVKNNWENPSDPSAPVSGNVHVAVTPENELNGEQPAEKAAEPKVNKRDKRDPSQLSTMGGVKKKKNKSKK